MFRNSNKKTEDEWAEIILDLTKSKEERIQAAFHLENATNKKNIEKLVKALFTDPSPIVRHEFAFVLGENPYKKLIAPYLMKSVETDSNIFVRHESILALATQGDSDFIPFVKKFLDDPIPEVAESAEIALERLENTPNN